jgi:uncharacterized protein (DUF1697 family)
MLSEMAVIISLLRGVNLGGYHRIAMADLRELYESLGLRDVQTCLQSGNVVFRSGARDLAALAKRIEKGIERSFGFRSDVVLRTASELRDTIAACPFASRPGLDAAKLAVTFLAREPDAEALAKVGAVGYEPEELRLGRREMYVYFPHGMGRTRFSVERIEKILETAGTSRNWNTVRRLLDLAEEMEARTARASG